MITYFGSPFKRDRPDYRARLCRWLEMNGVDPRRVYSRTGVKFTGTHLLFMEFVTVKRRNGSTRRVIRPNGAGYLKRPRKVRCTVLWDEVSA